MLAQRIVGLVLLVAIVGKARNWGSFFQSLQKFAPIRRGFIVHSLGAAIVLAELTLGIMLIGLWAMPWSNVATAALLTLFTFVVSFLGKDKPKSCGCFGSTELGSSFGWSLAFRNSGLTCLVLSPTLSDTMQFVLIGIGVLLLGTALVAENRSVHSTNATLDLR